MRSVYLDNNASTPIDPRVLRILAQTSEELWANPASGHPAGRVASACIEGARDAVARLIGASANEILFTSGATESLNLAILGAVPRERANQLHVVTSMVEHAAVQKPIEFLHRSYGLEVTVLRPDREGRVTPHQVTEALRENTAAVILIHGNNEIGTLTDIHAIGEAMGTHPTLFIVDASQTSGYAPPQVSKTRIDLMCISSHKMHGPKGIGTLYRRSGVVLEPILFGGGQEGGIRPGTLPVPLIAALGETARIALSERQSRTARVMALRNCFVNRLRAELSEIQINGDLRNRLPGNLSLTFPFVEAAHLQTRLKHIAFSRGSACSTSSGHLSHVLQAIGLSHEEAHWTIRIGISFLNTEEEMDYAAGEFILAIKELMTT